ncbi:MAG: hypothetical protein CMP80_04390 [Formosa sp.]|nr:hypothetical protein [Formosa sp.]
MNNNQHFIKRILALFLLGILLLPSLVNIIHHCEIHAHFECNEQKAHLHQSETNCEICDFNLLNFNYELGNRENLEKPQIFEALNTFYTPLQFHSFLHQSIQLRAPPVMS